MNEKQSKLLIGAKEALAIARGEAPAARIVVNGWVYVPLEQTTKPLPETTLEAGKYYSLRNGLVVGPMKESAVFNQMPWEAYIDNQRMLWRQDGKCGHATEVSDLDVIEEHAPPREIFVPWLETNKRTYYGAVHDKITNAYNQANLMEKQNGGEGCTVSRFREVWPKNVD